jgi:hypothetical protein
MKVDGIDEAAWKWEIRFILLNYRACQNARLNISKQYTPFVHPVQKMPCQHYGFIMAIRPYRFNFQPSPLLFFIENHYTTDVLAAQAYWIPRSSRGLTKAPHPGNDGAVAVMPGRCRHAGPLPSCRALPSCRT